MAHTSWTTDGLRKEHMAAMSPVGDDHEEITVGSDQALTIKNCKGFVPRVDGAVSFKYKALDGTEKTISAYPCLKGVRVTWAGITEYVDSGTTVTGDILFFA